MLVRADLVVYLFIPTSNHNHVQILLDELPVVYLFIPTSNHNSDECQGATLELYISLFLHQTTTFGYVCKVQRVLYISLFLHQTTTFLLDSEP